MNFVRLFKILWGRRLFVLAPTVATLIGGVVVIMTFPPRYEATNRIILDIIKPDPVTGFQVSDKMYDAYISSEINMLRNDDVTGRVVEAMGWLENPDMVAAWQSAPDKGDDLRRWAGRRLSFGIGADMVTDTNVMEIKFQSTAPELAKLVADNIRTSFIEASIAQTRDSARASATNLSAQAEQERERLVELQQIKANLERETGLMVGEGGVTDADKDLLEVARSAPIHAKQRYVTQDDSQALRNQLQNIDSSIVAAGRTLGPNNPMMVEMQRRRDYIAAQLAGVHPADPVETLTQKRLAAVETLARSSANRLTSVSDKTLALRLVQDEINRRRTLFNKVAARAGQQLEISNVSDANLTPIGQTVVKPAPVFPNFALILGGCGVLGLMVGSLLALIIESLARRVRIADDLRTALEAPLLGVLPAIASPRAARVKIRKVRTPKPAREPKPARGKKNLARA